MVDHTWGSEKHKHGMTPVGYGYKSQDAFNYENKYASSEIGEDGMVQTAVSKLSLMPLILLSGHTHCGNPKGVL